MSLDNQSQDLFGQTPWQTVGPFFHTSLPWKGGADLVGNSDIGARADLIPRGHDLLRQQGARGAIAGRIIDIVGRVLDGDGAPVPDALIEIWQANAAGRYNSPADARDVIAIDAAFTGFGRAATGEDGAYRFHTIQPGRVPGPGNSLQAPHAALSVLGRGLLKRLVTRIYFEDGEGNADDPILALAPADRRGALIARREGPATYRFDIHLQGEHESVFFDV
ncbi:MAG TPA: protocatechuate 3,4-dioxygenase subunit alpha [Caulobacteraceae bacterium]|nr:protocatechuate 3,4-dioxygenase subunit alpha [Caulobacteraceae bacterium]